ncbi:hypothetical protein GCM10007890_33320 [Methylobacterium tardum]|uniref:Response regulatory domain-containing protein n=1 Tax=Methylobacterium tardum TaxID=374432 RepID=A0AA37WSL9_9HYPH|nr:hypothetical protein GCM10007890_33320 [Methylobacterium tardum]
MVVAEDDPIALRMVAAELEAAGCQAVTCSDGIAALEHVAFGERLDALVTDVHMPGSVDGLFLATEVRALRPDLPVVYLSGRSVETRHMVPGSRFLGKPYGIGRLADIVRSVLGAGAEEMEPVRASWSFRLEAERRFLVSGDGWLTASAGCRRLSDGLIANAAGMKVRVRKDGGEAWLTVKGPRAGVVRAEFEWEITTPEADSLLRSLQPGERVEKVRHRVPHGGSVWTVDVFEGDLDGVVLAEVELDREDQEVDLPDWVGREVTGDPRFSQAALRAMEWKTA